MLVASLCFLVFVEPPEESELHREGGVRSGTRPVWQSKTEERERRKSDVRGIKYSFREMKNWMKKNKWKGK